MYSLRIPLLWLLFVSVLAVSCNNTSKTETSESTESTGEEEFESAARPGPSSGDETYIVPSEDRDWDTTAYESLVAHLPPFDLNQDISGKSLEELRILRNTIAARKGYLFNESGLRHYFYTTGWYKELMEARWYGACESSGVKPAPPIAYSPEETAFMERVKKAEAEKKGQNYIVRNGLKYANVKNIVNAWQFGGIAPELLDGLDRNGFAVVLNNNVQLFHLYEQNDYTQTQNFVTTDLYMQLFHMHFSMMLRGLEETKFTGILTDLTLGMNKESERLAAMEKDANTKKDLQYTQAYYAIPHNLLSKAKNVSVPSVYQDAVKEELKKIENGGNVFSSLLSAYASVEFPYDMFKPRGHYTRTDELKHYFQSMQWLQLGAYCLDEASLRQAMTAAFVLNTGVSPKGESLVKLYRSILDPTTFLIGAPDNLSLLDVCNILNNRNIKSLKALLAPETISAVRKELEILEKTHNVIKPKIELTCPVKINFMPARFVLDNEILQEMVDFKKRPYPKGLDVFAAFGSTAAENILTKELKENSKWADFLPHLEKMKSKYRNFEDWDATVYAKWVQGLNALLKPDKQYPSFMQLPSWNKKNLNTALASWAELKHDAILYAEQPSAAECGGGGECSPPPEPYVLGYVEPNIHYWKNALELLKLTSGLLDKHGLLDDKLTHEQNQLVEMCSFLLGASEKELRGQDLNEQEYNTIEKIGSSVEWLTLGMFGTDNWAAISGPDREVAVVADIYTNNQGDEAGILHAATGYVNDLYVVVEIGGYLYLTKGATFSYYEFPLPLGQRMTDEEWQEKLKKGKVFPLEPWFKDLIVTPEKTKAPPIAEYLYSSGC